VTTVFFCFKTLNNRVGSPGQKPPGRVRSQVKNPEPVPSLICTSMIPIQLSNNLT